LRNEAEIRWATRKALEALGWFVLDFEQNRKGTRVEEGLADLAVMGWGHFAWAEMKTATGKQSDKQVRFQAKCQAAGIPYHLWRHENEALEWAQAKMKQLGVWPGSH